MCPYRLCVLCAGSLRRWRHNASTASAWTHVKLIGPSVEFMRKIALKMAAALDLKMAAPLDLKMETPLLLKMAAMLLSKMAATLHLGGFPWAPQDSGHRVMIWKPVYCGG